MTAKLLLIKSENGLETRQDYDGLSSANPAFTGTLTGDSAALTGGVDAGGEIKSGALVGTGARPVVALADGTIDDQPPATFLGTIGALAASLKGAANGVAELGSDGRVPLAQLPSYVDEVVEYPDFASFPTTGEDGKIYVAIDGGTSWRWSGTIYVQISSSLTIGSTASTAHRGDHGTTAYNHSQLTADNPHGTTAAQVGAEPYAGVPAATSFWRSTAAGVRAWVQLVAADITDLTTTLAAYLTKANPTFTGTLTGPTATLSGSAQEALRLRRSNATVGQIHGIDFQGQTADLNWVNYARIQTRLASTANGAQTGDLRMLVYDSGISKIALDATPSWITFGAGIGLVLNDTVVIDSSRNITGTTIKGSNLTGAGNRPLVAGADGTIDDQDAATFRGTIGAGTSSLALGETPSTAYRGDRGKIAYDHSQAAGNPHGTTAAQVGAMAAANPSFTGSLSQGATERITAGGDGRFTSLRASGLAASNTYLPRLDANGGFVASPVRVTPGVGVVFEQAASLQAGGGAWGGSAYTSWTPSAIVPIADDTAGNAMPSLGTGYLWNSQRLNAMTITDGAAASPYRGRIRADRWVGTSAVLISGTTSATSWFAAGTGEGSPSLPANYLKGGRRVRAKGRTSCQSCAADSAPEFTFKIGSTTIKTQAKAFTVASGNAIYIDFDVDFFTDGDGFLIAVGDIKFYSPAVGSSYEYKISYVGAYDGSTAKTIDATIKPSSSGETWARNTAFIEA